jgi:hypothetical protein
MLEYWKIGMMAVGTGTALSFSTIPVFHHSIIPSFHHSSPSVLFSGTRLPQSPVRRYTVHKLGARCFDC